MEPSGPNQWQSLANRKTAKTATGTKLLLVAAVLGASMVMQACSGEGGTSGERAGPASFVIGARTLGGLPLSPATSFRQMRGFFASPASARFEPGACRLRIRRLGLFAVFTSFVGGVGRPSTCNFFLAAVVTRAEWHTRKRLRVGATLRALRRAYPRAYRTGEIGGAHWGIPSGAIGWELAVAPGTGNAARTVLVAYVKQRRVVGLGMQTAGH